MRKAWKRQVIMNIQTRTINIEKRDTAVGTGQIDSLADYVICRADPADSVYEDRLCSMGFRFLDRMLYFEIDLKAFEEKPADALSGIDFVCDDRFDDDVYALAHAAYTTDRRFHLKPVFDQVSANEVMDAYIDEFRDRELKLYKALHGRELLGFAVVDENADTRHLFFENVLGATRPGIKGKMIAAPLYSAMLAGERDRFRKYAGRVSSSNMASVNLHFQLGGHVTKIYDEFIYENKRR